MKGRQKAIVVTEKGKSCVRGLTPAESTTDSMLLTDWWGKN
ncbi:MAG: hypothetical protein CM15mP58_21530 [Burkholderiaceae bacterium]|nr:MAG: hypothetical protein CM15mP58_21530 [Burkholderiaceae bacterium]